MKKEITKKESSNIKIGVILSLVSFVVSMVVNLIFIRFINNPDVAGQSQYGLYTFSTSMTSLLLALSFGMNSSYIRFATIAKKESGEDGLKKINGSFVLLFLLSTLLAIILGTLIILAFYFGLIGSNYDDSKRAIIISCLIVSVANVAISLLSNIFTLYTNFHMRFIWARTLTITTSIMTPLITSIIIYFNHNIITYVCVELGVNILAMLVNILFCIKALKYRVKISFHKSDFHILKSILAFSFFIFLVTIVTELTSSTPKILLGLFPNPNGDSEITVAYYQLAATFIGAIAVASSAVSSTYVPLVNRFVAYGTNDDVNRLFLKASKTMIIAYAFVMGGFIACGRQFIVLWQGDNYENTDLIYFLACALAVISFIPSTFGITSEIQRAKNKHHFRSFALILGFAINFAISIVFLLVLPFFVDKNDSNYYVYQVIACASGFAAGNIVNAIVMSIYNKKVIKVDMLGYYKIILTISLLVGVALAIDFVIFRFVPIRVNLVVEMILRGSVYIVLFAVLLTLFYMPFIKGIFKSENTEVPKETKLVSSINQPGDNKTVFVFKDFYKVVNEIVDNDKSESKSLFNNNTMHYLLQLHEKTNFKCTLLFTKDINIKKLPKSILKEIEANSSWLTVAFSSGKHYPYSFIDAPFIGQDLSVFAKKMIKHSIKIENIAFPDFDFTETHLSYFKGFFEYKILGIGVFNNAANEKESIKIKNNLLFIKINELSSNDRFKYFTCDEVEKINVSSNDEFINFNNLIDEVFKNKDYPLFYKKKVAFINTYNSLSTGTIAKTIMNSLESVGFTTKLFYGRLFDSTDTKSYYFGTNKFVNLINNVYVKFSGNIGHAHYFETRRLIKKLKEYNPDVIHLHNIAGNCLNYGVLFKYLADKKVIVTMHDCYWLTGRCSHFTYNGTSCDKWKTGCKKCNHLDYYMRSYFIDRASKLFNEKRNFVNNCRNLKLVCISKWQKDYFDISNIPSEKITLIHNGFNINCDLSLDSKSNSKTKLIFVSSYLSIDKGINEINKLADLLDENLFEIEVIGKLTRGIKLHSRIKYSGSLANKDVIKHIASSDLFIYPTHADTFPTVLIESLMVGTPAVSYDVGGCGEIIGKFGQVVKFGDVESLANKIQSFDYSSFNRSEISSYAKDAFGLDAMLDKYIELYEEVLKNE